MKVPNPLSTALAIATFLTISSSLSFVHSSSWQILTNHNFSSQIRLHPHVLLLITVPWSGESRSLMKEVSLITAEKSQEFSNLKLMVIHMNMENQKTLADSLGANVDGITVIYFHYSVSFKYRGRLAAKSILSSLHFYMSIAPEEVPFKTLNSARDFRTFLDSTDQALILVDFCGWTSKLLAKSKKNNVTENGE